MFSFSVIFSLYVLLYLTFSFNSLFMFLLCLHHYLVFVFSICVLILVRLGELIEKTYLIDDSYHVSLVLHDFLSLKNIININYL